MRYNTYRRRRNRALFIVRIIFVCCVGAILVIIANLAKDKIDTRDFEALLNKPRKPENVEVTIKPHYPEPEPVADYDPEAWKELKE